MDRPVYLGAAIGLVAVLSACGPSVTPEEKQCRTIAFIRGLGAMASTRTVSATSAVLQGSGYGANAYGECLN